jgi:hypothetical protein
LDNIIFEKNINNLKLKMGICMYHARRNKFKKKDKNITLPEKRKYTISYIESEFLDKINYFLKNDVIQDSIFDKGDPEDSTYNQIIKEEKEELIKYFNSKKDFLNNEISNFLSKKKLGFISNLVSQIISSENGKDIYSQKILREIEEINKKEESFKINN